MPSAQKWRIRCTIGYDATYFGCREFMFLQNPGDSSQPGGGSATSSTPAAGSAAGAFDGNTVTDFATAHGGGTGYLEFDFSSAQTIGEVYYDPRTSFASQAPRHMVVEYYDGAAWQVAADIPGITPAWVGGTAKRFAVPYPGDEAGGHRYWRINVSAVFSGSLWSAVEIGFVDGSTNINQQYDAIVSTGGFTTPQNLFEGTETGDAIGNSASLPAYAGLDFGRKRVINSVYIVARGNGSFVGQTPKTFTIDYSDDGSSWTTAASFSEAGGTPSANQKRTYTLSSTETSTAIMAFAGISYTATATRTGNETSTGVLAFSTIAFAATAIRSGVAVGIMAFQGIAFTSAGARTETTTAALHLRGLYFTAATLRIGRTATGAMHFGGITIVGSCLRAPAIGTGKRGFWAFGA